MQKTLNYKQEQVRALYNYAANGPRFGGIICGDLIFIYHVCLALVPAAFSCYIFSMTKKDSPRIADWLDALDEALRAMVLELRALVHEVYPQVQEEFKYGGILFSLPGGSESIGGIYAYTKHVSLVFSNGFLLEDPEKILQGNGKFRRHCSFQVNHEISNTVLKQYIIQLEAIDRARVAAATPD